MNGYRRSVVVVTLGAVVLGLIAVAAFLRWRSQTARLEELEELVTAFEPPDEWDSWVLVDRLSRDYQFYCADARCPQYSERYATAVPEGDIDPSVTSAIENLGIGPVELSRGSCPAGDSCLFEVSADGNHLSVFVANPMEGEQGMLDDVPSGFGEVTVNIRAT